MHYLVKRGLQTALITGGMVALGAGVASAAEAHPMSPLGVPAGVPLVSGDVEVPVNIAHNQVGTLLGPIDVLNVQQNISTKEAAKALPLPAHPLASKSLDVAAPQSISRSNTVQPDVCLPIDISGNAIAAGGDAATNNNSHVGCNAGSHAPLVVDGRHGSISANVIGVDLAVPVQLTNNAIAAAGNAYAEGNSDADAYAGRRPIISNGALGSVSGNIIDPAAATPIQFAENAIAVGGNADTNGKTTATAKSGGMLRTNGDGGTLSGNIGGVPAGLPVEANGNAVSWVGNTHAKNTSGAEVRTGGTDANGNYAVTSGDPSTLDGNIIGAPIASKALLAGNAVSWVGNAGTNGVTDNDIVSGGHDRTRGDRSTGSGNVVNPAVALPAEVFGDGVTWVGTAEAADLNKVNTKAGGDFTTNGDKSTLGANAVSAPLAGAVDFFGNPAALVGNVDTNSTNKVDSDAGGYEGATGDHSSIGGNIVSVPVAEPAEVFAVPAAAVGNVAAKTCEVKDVEAGGITNTNDDKATLAANIAQAAASAPVQIFGSGVGAVANTDSAATNQLTTTAGDKANATGVKGAGSGNIVPFSLATPVQGFGDGVHGLGTGTSLADNLTSVTSGGTHTTDGRGGALTGNIVGAQGSGPAQLLGSEVAAGGVADALGRNNTRTDAGGANTTNGTEGSIAGSVLDAPLAPAVEAFGDSVNGAAVTHALGDSKAFNHAGGANTTTADGGAVSGLIGQPGAALPVEAFGDSGTVGGISKAWAANFVHSTAGGDSKTSGQLSSLSADVASVPVAGEALAPGLSVAGAGNSDAGTTSEVINRTGGTTATTGKLGALAGDIAQAPVVADLQPHSSPVGVGGLAFAKNVTQQMNHAGGDTATSGLAGAASGDVASVPVAGNLETVHDAATLAGISGNTGANKAIDHAGGNLASNGTAGSLSGDLLQVPTNALAQVFGNSVAAGGNAATNHVNVTDLKSAGSQTTSGALNTVSGVNGKLPIGAASQVWNIPVELLGNAVANERNVTTIQERPLVDLPVTNPGLLGATQLPALRGAQQERSLPTGGLTNLGGLTNVGGLTGALPLHAAVPAAPAAAQARELPGVGGENMIPAASLNQLGGLTKLDGLKLTPNADGAVEQRDLPAAGKLPSLDAATGLLKTVHLG